MDRIEITSSYTQQTWQGIAPLDGVSDWEKLGSAFKFFNRVTEEDVRRLAEIEFNQPSLSAGDRIVLNGTPYKCEPVGFTRDTRDSHQPLNPWPL